MSLESIGFARVRNEYFRRRADDDHEGSPAFGTLYKEWITLSVQESHQTLPRL